MGLTAGNAAGYRGGVINTGIEAILVLAAAPVVPFLPGPALRDGFSHVLGLRIIVPVAVAAPLWPAVAAAAMFTSSDVAASLRPAVAAAAICRRFIFSGTPAFFSSRMIRHPHGSGCPDIHNYKHDVLLAPVDWLRNRRSCTFQHSVVTLGRQYDQFQPSCDVGECQQQCHRLSKIRPRASRSSSHRDER